MASIYTKLPSDIQGVIRSYVRPIHPVVNMVGIAYNRHIKKGLHNDIVIVNKLAGVKEIEIHWQYSVENRRDGRATTYYRRFSGYIHDTHSEREILDRLKGYIHEAGDMAGYEAEIDEINIWYNVYGLIADRIQFVNEAFEDYYIMRDNDEITFEKVIGREQN
jgi:hypothetical protein